MRKVCLRVDQRLGEQLRRLLIEKGLLDSNFPITEEEKQLYFPLQRTISEAEQAELEQATRPLAVTEKELEPIIRKPPDLATALAGKLPTEFIELLPHSLDIIGNIAIVEVEPDLSPYEKIIGDAIQKVNFGVTTVYAKEGAVKGVFRVRPLRLISGKAQSTTVHTEYGIKLAVDVLQTYFSPRLGTEHDRVTRLVKPNELIVDMFTGIGPFALLAAKRQPVTVYAIDINEQAIQCLKKSLTLNKLTGKVIPLIGDARQIIQKQLKGKTDRVIMNLPQKAFDYLEAAAAAIKPSGGTIHFYGITTRTLPLKTLSDDVITEFAKHGRKAILSSKRIVRPFAPHEFQVAIDYQISS